MGIRLYPLLRRGGTAKRWERNGGRTDTGICLLPCTRRALPARIPHPSRLCRDTFPPGEGFEGAEIRQIRCLRLPCVKGAGFFFAAAKKKSEGLPGRRWRRPLRKSSIIVFVIPRSAATWESVYPLRQAFGLPPLPEGEALGVRIATHLRCSQ